MEVSCLSTAYRVRCLEEADVPQILRLCSGNPQFYQYHPPLATADSVRADIRALPPGKMPEDKFYVGYFAGDDLSTSTPSEERLTAVLDLILDYPEEKTAYIGFFMVDAAMQGNGLGSRLAGEAAAYLRAQGYTKLRLGVDRGIHRACPFGAKTALHRYRRESTSSWSGHWSCAERAVRMSD